MALWPGKEGVGCDADELLLLLLQVDMVLHVPGSDAGRELPTCETSVAVFDVSINVSVAASIFCAAGERILAAQRLARTKTTKRLSSVAPNSLIASSASGDHFKKTPCPIWFCLARLPS